jgi:peptidyl-prolyl cis-trans isomerase SurA
MKRLLLGFWVILSLLGLFCRGEAMVDSIVAVVNQEIIMFSEVEKAVASLGIEIHAGDRLERKEQVKQVRQKVLNQLIEERLIDSEVKKVGIKVTGKEIDAAVEDIRRRNNVTQEEMERALEREGLTLEEFKKQLEKRMLRTKLIQWSVKVDTAPVEKELREFYQKNLDRYRTVESYRPAHILFRVPRGATPDEVREISKKCVKVLEKIRAGEDFGEMAILYSEDPSAKDRGDLGSFKQGELLPVIEREALRLKVGEVGEIVKTDYGLHIIKLLDRKEGKAPRFEDARAKVEMDYYEYQMEKAFRQFLSSLREKSVIDVRL